MVLYLSCTVTNVSPNHPKLALWAKLWKSQDLFFTQGQETVVTIEIILFNFKNFFKKTFASDISSAGAID